MGPEIGHFFDSLGWAILHSIWQGGLAAIAVVLFRSVTKDSQASLRYGFQTLCLMGTLAAFVATLVFYQVHTPTNVSVTFQAGSAFEPISALFTQNSSTPTLTEGQSLAQFIAPYTPLLGVMWCLGVALLTLRYTGAFVMTQRLRTVGISEAPNVWQSRFQTLVLNAGLRRNVQIFISNRVSGPLTLGFFKPVVLVPASFFTGLSASQVEAILLHEIAHIRRHDYLINLFQTAVKSIFFFHPAVHYISRRIDQDREHACDDFAVALTRDPQALARGLAALRLDLSPKTFALAADNGNTPLVARLKRLGNVSETRRKPEHVLTSVMTLVIAAGLYVAASPMADAHQTPAPTPTPEPAPVPKFDISHPSGKLGNYRFETARMNGRTFTVKIAGDGSRWVNVDGAWHDIDKNPSIVAKLPKTPVPPTPPTGKAGAVLGSQVQSYGQYKVDLDYYIAQLEMAEGKASLPELAGKSPTKMKKIHEKRVRAERTRDKIERLVEEALEDSQHKKEQAWEEAKNEHAMKPGLYINGDYAEGLDQKPWAQQFHKDMAKIEKQRLKGQLTDDQADDARDRAEDRFEAHLERHQEQQEHRQEAALEHALRQQERQLERAERHRERAMERAEEQRERAMERAEEQRERAEHYKEFNDAMLSQLKADKLITSTANTVTITYPGMKMTVNGVAVPSNLEDTYCELLSDYDLKKDQKTVITLSPNGFQYKSVSRDGKSKHHVRETFKPHKKEASAAHASQTARSWTAIPVKAELPALPFINPTSEGWISQGFKAHGDHKKPHGGIDLASPMKTPIKASAPGVVTYAKAKGKWGNMIKITHEGGYETHYAHVGEICVDEGKTVAQGDHIGSVGSTGASTGPHLHFEIRQNGKSLNPEAIIADT